MNFRPAVCLLWTAAALAVLAVTGCTTGKDDEENTTKVLMIGNSFSLSVLHHLPQVAADRGVRLDLASLYIGGCSLRQHWENVQKDGDDTYRPYQFGRNVRGEYTQSKINVCEALRLAKWDIVTVQQVSAESWRTETYRPFGDDLVAKIRELAPQAKIVVQETWSYTPWDRRLAEWGIDQDEMYDRLHEAYGVFAKRHGLEVIPFGTAVQEWRRRLPVKYAEYSFGGDVVGGGNQDEGDHFKRTAKGEWVPNSDVFHLGRKGNYFQALVWAVKLFDVDLAELSYKPAFVTDDEAKLMREIAAQMK